MKFNFRNNTFILGKEKEMYWEEKKTLIISDLHLGKTKHFANNGIGMPRLANTNNYWRMAEVLDSYKVTRVIFLGDLFHSVYNEEWEKLKDFIANYENIEWVLILGNHDILHSNHYTEAKLLVEDFLIEEGFYFTHEPQSKKDLYNICGHLHPAVRMRGKAFQSLRLPCFYFGYDRAVLPAFGEFTGAKTIKPIKGDTVFVIVEKEVIRII